MVVLKMMMIIIAYVEMEIKKCQFSSNRPEKEKIKKNILINVIDFMWYVWLSQIIDRKDSKNFKIMDNQRWPVGWVLTILHVQSLTVLEFCPFQLSKKFIQNKYINKTADIKLHAETKTIYGSRCGQWHSILLLFSIFSWQMTIYIHTQQDDRIRWQLKDNFMFWVICLYKFYI